jgi:hypothetical protein
MDFFASEAMDFFDDSDVDLVPVEIAELRMVEIGSVPEKAKFRTYANGHFEFASQVDFPAIDSSLFTEIVDDLSVSSADLLGFGRDKPEELFDGEDSHAIQTDDKDATIPFDLNLLESTRLATNLGDRLDEELLCPK